MTVFLTTATILGGVAAIMFIVERTLQVRRQRRTMQYVWNADKQPGARALLGGHLADDHGLVAIVPAIAHNWHNAGRNVIDDCSSTGKAWLSDTWDRGGHVVYGPYERLRKPGNYRAMFRLRVDPATLDVAADVLRLDVIQHPGGMRTETNIAGRIAASAYGIHHVDFEYLAGGRIELRVEKLQPSRVWVDFVAVGTQAARKKQAPRSDSPSQSVPAAPITKEEAGDDRESPSGQKLNPADRSLCSPGLNSNVGLAKPA